ncbi:natural resistance-associated macrophage protein [Hanseniaspora valbyensis NRRL Y-1626]|uniref:Natural resistance-associated macrophage protein n=1 Tax=Hanseniaspora valbyensis NRRL Y-1626 TaxID=766949 RepID=A0A1B7TG79_9ASCO|nr:natural resistance-associated macrophage protein [Hanseniaspora valbyensis NRRL Y-1626]
MLTANRITSFSSYTKYISDIINLIGPGVIVSVAQIDNGNIATSTTSGALFKYNPLFIVILSNIFALIFQILSCKLGVVTGKDLCKLCKEKINPKLSKVIFVLVELSIVSGDLSQLIGSAVAMNILFKIPTNIGLALTVVDCFLVLIFYNNNSLKGVRIFEILVTLLVGATMLLFGIELKQIHIGDKLEVLKGTIPHFKDYKNSKFLYSQASIVGSNVMPINLIIGSYVTQARLKNFDVVKYGRCILNKPSLYAVKATLSGSIIELAIALLIAGIFVNGAIVVISGTLFYNNPNAVDADLKGIYLMLCQLVSKFAGKIFAVAILFAGQSASWVGVAASEIVLLGFMDLTVDPWVSKIITRLVALIPCLIIGIFFGDKGINAVLNFSQVLLALILPFVVIPLIMFTNDKEIMNVDKLHELEIEQGQEQDNNDENERLLGPSSNQEGSKDDEINGEGKIYFNNGNFLKWSSWSICFLITGLNIVMLGSILI